MHIYIGKDKPEVVENIKKMLEDNGLVYEKLDSETFDQVKFEVPSGDMMTGAIAMSKGASSSGGW